MKFSKLLLLLNVFALSGTFSFCGGEQPGHFNNRVPSLAFFAAKKTDLTQCNKPMPSTLIPYIHDIQSETSKPTEEEIIDAINKGYITSKEAFIVALIQQDASCVENIINRLVSATPEQHIKTAYIKIAQLVLSPKESFTDIDRMIKPSEYRSFIFNFNEPSGLSKKLLNTLRLEQKSNDDQRELERSADQLKESIQRLNHPADVENNSLQIVQFEEEILTAIKGTRAYESLPLNYQLKFILISFDLIPFLMPTFQEEEDFRRIYFDLIRDYAYQYLEELLSDTFYITTLNYNNCSQNNSDKTIKGMQFFARTLTDELKKRNFNKERLKYWTTYGKKEFVDLIYKFNPQVTGSYSRWDHKLRASIPYRIKNILLFSAAWLIGGSIGCSAREIIKPLLRSPQTKIHKGLLACGFLVGITMGHLGV